jgi:GNAT superfamily N-acetyltransferase
MTRSDTGADAPAARRDGGPGGLFRPLLPFDRAAYAAHLRRLSPGDRRSRFHADLGDAAVERHAAKALAGPGRVMGWFEHGALRGAAEVALSRGGLSAEAAFEVEEAWRGRGVGTALVGAALLWARNRGARRLIVHTTRRNVPMLRAAQAHGAAFEFDLADAEGAIEAHAPDLRSHLAELLAIHAAWRDWAVEETRRRWRGALHALLRPGAG